MDREHELILHPIGRVIQGRCPDEADALWERGISEIEIGPVWAGALEGIGGFSHIWVIWWLDQGDGRPVSATVHPEGRPEMPEVGLFATRSPRRPNPVAMTAVKLLGQQGNRLRVQGLDAYEGTQVVDIKPYLRRGDLISDATMPDWLERLWAIHDAERPE